jgi:predicted amidohydrolase
MSQLPFTLIQTALHWEDPHANMQMLTQKINALQHTGGIVILPEMFSTGFSMQPEKMAQTMDGMAVNWMQETAARKKIILTGSLIIQDEHGLYRNRLIWMLPNGQYGYYDKRHCFGFAGEDKHYTPGNKRLIAAVQGWRINLQICYDLRFPVWARQQQTNQQPEYDVLVYVANWPERRNTAWKSLLTARAIENQCYVIGVNRVGNDGNNIYHSGDSMVVNPLGETLYHKAHDEDVATLHLDLDELKDLRSRFPFLKDADAFNIVP